MMRFKMIKIRSKISFIALEKRMSLNELFFKTILKTYETQSVWGTLIEDEFHKKQLQEVFEAVMRGEDKIFTKLIAMRSFEKASIEEIKHAMAGGNHKIFDSIMITAAG